METVLQLSPPLYAGVRERVSASYDSYDDRTVFQMPAQGGHDECKSMKETFVSIRVHSWFLHV